jgi:hypothetical protein
MVKISDLLVLPILRYGYDAHSHDSKAIDPLGYFLRGQFDKPLSIITSLLLLTFDSLKELFSYNTYWIISSSRKIMMPNRVRYRSTINRMRWNTKMNVRLIWCIIIMLNKSSILLRYHWQRHHWKNRISG